jgi:aldose 1-epimerase
MILRIPVLTFGFAILALPATTYKAVKTTDHGVDIVRLSDEAHGTAVSIVPSVGNRAYEISVHGKNLLYFPMDVATFKAEKRTPFNGIPFLAPWANRMAGGGFWSGDKKYEFNGDLGTARIDSSGIAMHGLVTASPRWEVIDVGADENAAWTTSRLQFWKYPDLMANWPFAHEYEMTYRLTDGEVQVTTTVKNLSASPFPIAIGFHPYFNIPGASRSDETVRIPARKHVETDAKLVATGELTPHNPQDQISLKDHTFDDGFTDLVRDRAGNATFAVEAGARKIEVIYGPQYQVGVVYAPPKQSFICFEPMTAITNGVNLAHEGKYPALQKIDPDSTWKENFWIRFSGF